MHDNQHSVRSGQGDGLTPWALRERGSAPELHLVAWDRAAELDDQAIVTVVLHNTDAYDVLSGLFRHAAGMRAGKAWRQLGRRLGGGHGSGTGTLLRSRTGRGRG